MSACLNVADAATRGNPALTRTGGAHRPQATRVPDAWTERGCRVYPKGDRCGGAT